MWSDVVGLGFFTALNPMLLGFILLVISRPRPVPNLLVFWLGCLIVNVPMMFVPLAALHLVPSFTELARDLTTPEPGSSIQPFQLGTGIFAVAVAVLLAVRSGVKRRTPEPVTAGGVPDASDGATTVLVLDHASDPPPTGALKNAANKLSSKVRGFLQRIRDAWENGSLWVSLLFGLGYALPPPLALLVVTIIAGEGASVGTQIAAVAVFIFTMLAVLEIVLLTYVVAPTKTQAVLEPVHEWSHNHRQLILIVLFAVVGIWQMTTGLGLV
ncbi:GAP family protein [Mycolicibacterium smegmatis]|uniref:Integral membrane protein n=1 Tax=Mycolicibacterium smegmatis (strain MKD8) TaxID=1214915 RepID=A0A2U9PI27_MYCSE|nr:GAP family protein [Mycolicibacterium smegmatis]AWT51383.1 integral membrane protein [Mycolicibacterium smegmatis MKD8]